jgi:hypothetical protein
MLGDNELFVIPRAGKASWFAHGEEIRRVEWVQRKE